MLTVTRQPTDMMMGRLIDAVERTWSAETAVDPVEWSPENAAIGQCAITALVVEDYFGGAILRAEVNGVSHYWNQLPSGEEADLTIHQFGRVASRTKAEIRDREYLLASPDTARRYGVLAGRVADALQRPDSSG